MSNRRMPAEWEPHSATWIAWPHEQADWPGKFETIPWVYAEIVRHLSASEPVHVLVRDGDHEKMVRSILARQQLDLANFNCFQIQTDRSWLRDYGPIFVQEGDQLTALDWHFNGWAKYGNAFRDDVVTEQLSEQLGWPVIKPIHNDRRIVLEGGSIDVNGEGTLLTTRECLLSPIQERNPGLDQSQYEQIFREYLGIEKTIWLNRGIEGDDTHGHVDDLARFVGPETIVTVVESNEADPNHEPLMENLGLLRTLSDIEVIPLPMPEPLYFDGQRLPASYANFYVANQVVLVPTFNDPNDRQVLGILADLFPTRKVIGIHAVDLVWGLGTLHCLTQQQPELC